MRKAEERRGRENDGGKMREGGEVREGKGEGGIGTCMQNITTRSVRVQLYKGGKAARWGV